MSKKNKRFVVFLMIIAFLCIGISLYVTFSINMKDSVSGIEKNVKLKTTFTVTYDKNKAKSISTTSSKCYASGASCQVTMPTITPPAGYVVVGWSTSKDDTVAKYSEKETVDINKNMTLYAITREKDKINEELQVGNTCNKDTKCIVGNDFVDAACTQVGYKEKETDSKLDDCTANAGTNNFQKYGNSGNVWDASFVEWALKTAGINIGEFGLHEADEVINYVTWAKNQNRLYTNKSALKTGDLVLTNDNNHIGIAVKYGNSWYMIDGNHDNMVKFAPIEDATGFINMSGIVY